MDRICVTPQKFFVIYDDLTPFPGGSRLRERRGGASKGGEDRTDFIFGEIVCALTERAH